MGNYKRLETGKECYVSASGKYICLDRRSDKRNVSEKPYAGHCSYEKTFGTSGGAESEKDALQKESSFWDELFTHGDEFEDTMPAWMSRKATSASERRTRRHAKGKGNGTKRYYERYMEKSQIEAVEKSAADIGGERYKYLLTLLFLYVMAEFRDGTLGDVQEMLSLPEPEMTDIILSLPDSHPSKKMFMQRFAIRGLPEKVERQMAEIKIKEILGNQDKVYCVRVRDFVKSRKAKG